MSRYLPSRADLILFLIMAFVCGLIVQFSPQKDYVLGVLAIPVFLFASLRGLRRREALDRAEVRRQEQTAD
jgi:hypothetical protein